MNTIPLPALIAICSSIFLLPPLSRRAPRSCVPKGSTKSQAAVSAHLDAFPTIFRPVAQGLIPQLRRPSFKRELSTVYRSVNPKRYTV